MGYFDAVKQAKPEPAAPSNVTPIRRGDVHPYAAAAIAAELGRLDALPRPWHEGARWDTTTFEVACNLLELANSPWSGYTLADAERDLMAHAPADTRWGRTKHEAKWASAQARVGGAGRDEPAPGTEYTPNVIEVPITDLAPAVETGFWDERKILRHLHDYARARRVSPWAVLGVTLARIITATPVEVALPPIVGGKASLNLFVGLVGPSGSGKGAAEAVSADAVHVGYITSHNVGSGEGIAHGYKRRIKGELEWVDDRHAVLFSVPEIDSLAAQGDRRGATLMPQLRSGWTGEQLGFGYADPTKRIIVEAHQYRLCLVAGIQPGRAACLLDDADGLVEAGKTTELAGGDITIGGTADAPTLTDGQGNTAKVLCGNIPTSNATVFVIDKVLIPMVLNAHAGTKYGISFPVLCRAAFGVKGANLPAILRADGRVAFAQRNWIRTRRALPDDPDLSPVQHRHPGRVIPPILQAPQPGQQDRKRLLTTGIADDPTHPVRLPSCDNRRRDKKAIVAAEQPSPARS